PADPLRRRGPRRGHAPPRGPPQGRGLRQERHPGQPAEASPAGLIPARLISMGVFLRADWRHLAMLNYEVDPAVLRARVPAGTALESFGGKTYVSVVGFMFTKTVVKGIAVPFHRDFEEVNLRFYVKRRPPGGHDDGRDDRRGVVFVKELVPRFAIAWMARVVYRENYVSLPMRHRLGEDGTAEYGFRMGRRWSAVFVRPEGDPQPTAPGSLEEFIAEHYWGYAAQAD